LRAGEQGFLVTPGDVDELAATLRRFLEQPALIETMGARGRAAVRGFGTMTDDLERAYRRLAARPLARDIVTCLWNQDLSVRAEIQQRNDRTLGLELFGWDHGAGVWIPRAVHREVFARDRELVFTAARQELGEAMAPRRP
jgi:hypothetical protein